MTLTITLRDAERLAEQLHALRLMAAAVQADAPALPEADGAVGDAMAAIEEAISALEGVRSAVLSHLRQLDERDSGDRDPDGEPRPMPRPRP